MELEQSSRMAGMNGITTIAALPSGAGRAAALPPEVGEARKAEEAPVELDWWDFYDIARSSPSAEGEAE